MNTNIINLHNLSLEEEECMICKEPISSAQTFKLPECNHVYHTHCIVSWFRNGDSRCPYCGNKGINHEEKCNRISRRWWKHLSIHDAKIKYLRSYAKKNNGPILLIKELNKLDKAINILKEREKQIKDFKEKIKTEKMLVDHARKERNKLRNNKWNIDTSIYKIKQNIIDLHIVPIIIPTPIDINS